MYCDMILSYEYWQRASLSGSLPHSIYVVYLADEHIVHIFSTQAHIKPVEDVREDTTKLKEDISSLKQEMASLMQALKSRVEAAACFDH